MDDDDEYGDYIDGLKGTMPEGRRALEALVLYRAADLPCPEWALEEIANCYEAFTTGVYPAGWSKSELRGEAPKTLGQAFGVEDHAGNMHARRQRAMLTPLVDHMFVTGAKRLPRSDAGDAQAGESLGVSPDLIKKLRKEVVTRSKGKKS